MKSPKALLYNPFLLSIILIGWLFFKPSGWRRYIASLDNTLSPDFAIADLRLTHWREPALRYLLYSIHLIWPVWVSCLLTITAWYLDKPTEMILLTSCYALLFSFVSGLLASFTVSVMFGTIVASLGAMLLTMPILMTGEVIFSMAENIAVAVVYSVSESETTFTIVPEKSTWGFITVLLGTFVASLSGSLMHSATKTRYSHPQYRQIGSIVIGVFISGLVVFLIAISISALARSAATLMESGLLFTLVYDSLISGLFGIAFLFIWGFHTGRWLHSIALGIGVSSFLAFFTFLDNNLNESPPWDTLVIAAHGGVENAFLYLFLFAFPYTLARRIASPWAGVIAGMFGSLGTYLTFVIVMKHSSFDNMILWILLTFVLGLSIHWWRPLLFYPLLSAWNLILYRADERRERFEHHLFGWHSAFWDEHQRLPLFGLENYLVLMMERSPAEGRAAMDRLSTGYQSWAAREAQIELDARRLHQCDTVESISTAHRSLAAGELAGPVSALLRSFSRLSRDVEAALAQESTYNQRLALDGVEERLDGLLRELTRSSEHYASRFRPIAAKWRHIIADYVKTLVEAVESRQEINNPYIIGIPLTEHQEIFVGRSDVSERIEKLLLDRRCPPLLLYGQRRTGKTSLLNNLGKLLPSTIIPAFVDLQGPTSLAKNEEGFLYNISRAILTSAKRHRDLALPILAKETLSSDPFTRFDEWLDELERCLDPEQTFLLSLDEFSALEHVFSKGRLDEAFVLGMFRHIIQHRPRFKILLSGSHTLDEFERWASYLINVQTVHLSYLQAKEALQLIEQPVKDFALRYEWEASQRIMELTRCHPALIQLVCAEIVSLKNKQSVSERRLAQVSDVEAAVPGALQHGRFFFADIANNQVNEKGLTMLQHIAQQGPKAIVKPDLLLSLYGETFESNLTQLLQRELIEPLGGGYRFQVELVRRWFS